MMLLRVVGLEPTLLPEQEPKSCASANFATPACFQIASNAQADSQLSVGSEDGYYPPNSQHLIGVTSLKVI